MELTWVAIVAALLMGIGAVLIFIFSVKQDYFQNLEDAKYQVFWSDLEDLVDDSSNLPKKSTQIAQTNTPQPISTIKTERDFNDGNKKNRYQ